MAPVPHGPSPVEPEGFRVTLHYPIRLQYRGVTIQRERTHGCNRTCFRDSDRRYNRTL